MKTLNFYVKENSLLLEGELSYSTLLPLWEQRKALVSDSLEKIDLSSVAQIDSAGLALLVKLLTAPRSHPLKLIGIDEKCKMLIDLYNLESVIGDSL